MALEAGCLTVEIRDHESLAGLREITRPPSRRDNRSAVYVAEFLLSTTLLGDGDVSLQRCPLEHSAVRPNAMHDHGDLPGHRNGSLSESLPRRKSEPPALERRELMCAVQDRTTSLVETSAQLGITRSRDATGVVHLPRLI